MERMVKKVIKLISWVFNFCEVKGGKELLAAIPRVIRWVAKEEAVRSVSSPTVSPTAGARMEKRIAKEREKKVAKENVKVMIQQLEHFLSTHYHFRFNLLSEQPEYCNLGQEEEGYLQVTQRVLNSLCIEAQEAGIACWDKDVKRFLYSLRLKNYHPLLAYMEQLPAWDGQDRITPLAHRIATDELWVAGFRCWLLGMTNQWMGRATQCANSLAPMLISARQGWGKSTFCSLLVPDGLKPYYTDSFELTGQLGCEQKLAFFGLINLDEFDRISVKKLPLLKNLMQMATINFRKAHRASFSHMPRIASFIGTSNQQELLADPSGSRRYLCMELTHPIDVTPLAHKQLFAQLKALLVGGERHWLSAAEELEWQKRNRRFSRLSSAKSLFLRAYSVPQEGDSYQLLTSAAIHAALKKRYPVAMREVLASSYGRLLLSWGVERVHTAYGNQFKVVVG
ncbi:MAG: VapE domain-containing protein [Phocaeicola sp.]